MGGLGLVVCEYINLFSDCKYWLLILILSVISVDIAYVESLVYYHLKHDFYSLLEQWTLFKLSRNNENEIDFVNMSPIAYMQTKQGVTLSWLCNLMILIILQSDIGRKKIHWPI